jgi:hypothetical protein
MADQTPPSPQPGWQPGSDPKAAAKAAKAYAKASRPWWQKKRFILLAAIVVIVIIAVATSGGGGDGDNGPQKVGGSPQSSGADNGPGTKSNPIKVGETVKLEGTQYTVRKVRKSASVGGQYVDQKANGIYVVVTLTIENKKKETHTFSDSAAKLVTKDGITYSTDEDGSIYADNSLVLEDMQPDVPKTGVLVFDVPPAKAKGSVLKVSDLFGNGSAYIDLGLK